MYVCVCNVLTISVGRRVNYDGNALPHLRDKECDTWTMAADGRYLRRRRKPRIPRVSLINEGYNESPYVDNVNEVLCCR